MVSQYAHTYSDIRSRSSIDIYIYYIYVVYTYYIYYIIIYYIYAIINII